MKHKKPKYRIGDVVITELLEQATIIGAELKTGHNLEYWNYKIETNSLMDPSTLLEEEIEYKL